MKWIWKVSALLHGDRVWAINEGKERSGYLAVLEMQGDVKEIIFIVAWFIWFARNSAIHDASQWSAVSINVKTELLLSEFSAANFAPRIA